MNFLYFKPKSCLLLAGILLFFQSSLFAQDYTPKQKDYLDYAIKSVDLFSESYPAYMKEWKDSLNMNKSMKGKVRGDILFYVYVNANLFDITGKSRYADRAKSGLIEYTKLSIHHHGIEIKNDNSKGAAIIDFFLFPYYLKSFKILSHNNRFSKDEEKEILMTIIESANHLFLHNEWGAINRSAIRAESFLLASKLMPNIPDSKIWQKTGNSLLDDCINRWQIEDSPNYHSIFYYTLFNAAEIAGRKDIWDSPITAYMMRYFSRLLAPYGNLPDYGDGTIYENWFRFLPIFEKAASVYNNSEYKYAAHYIFNCLWSKFASDYGINFGALAIDCYKWCSDKIKPFAPEILSSVVLDDLYGKKIVFRNGYQYNSTYMLLNFKDDGDFGYLDKEFLEQTIPVEEEKISHGHSDENSIPLLMDDGCILLHDGGYRDLIPSGEFGAYRADYFHNRTIVRQGKIFKGQDSGENRFSKTGAVIQKQNILDFIRNSGAHRTTRTSLINFNSSENFDYSHTRLSDDKLGYYSDRIIIWVKPLNIFVFFDAVHYLSEDYYTSVNLWHTQKILSNGADFFDTRYENLAEYKFPYNKSLLIYFPESNINGKTTGFTPEKRYYQSEMAIHQTISSYQYPGDINKFVTILIPHDSGSSVEGYINKIDIIETSDNNGAVALKIESEGKIYYIYSKIDSKMDLLSKDTRPKYDYDNGKVKFGKFETDAHQFFAIIDKDTIDYEAFYCIKVKYDDNITLFERKPLIYDLQFDGSGYRIAPPKVKKWSDKYIIK